MKQAGLIVTLLTTTVLCALLLSGCSEDQQAKDKKKATVQEQIGRDAAKSIQKPMNEAREAAELQSAGDQKIKAAAQSNHEKLEGC
ncbi:MAG: hypothetical protein AB7U29_07555 [Desulfobulbus sp.]